MDKPTRWRAGFGALAVLAVLTAACGNSDKTGIATDHSTVTVDDGKVSVETTAGIATIGKGLPEGFPKDAVPLVGEKVVAGTKGTAGGPFAWSVVMQSTRSVEDLTAEVQKDYASWDSHTGSGGTMGDLSVLHFGNATYDVGVTIARTGSNVTVTYLVKNAH